MSSNNKYINTLTHLINIFRLINTYNMNELYSFCKYAGFDLILYVNQNNFKFYNIY